MEAVHIQIILGALGIACALAFIIPAMFGTAEEDEYYSALAEWEDEWQARHEAWKQRTTQGDLFDDTKPM